MFQTRHAFAAALILLCSGGVAAEPPLFPEHTASDPSAPEVNARNLVAGERFWPYAVELVSAWKPPGLESAIRVGTRGVVVRVSSGQRARIDFGRHGIFDMPIDATDLLARANRIRLGQEQKQLPNFVEAIGPRLLSSDGDLPRAVSLETTFAHDGFFCVFADPSSADFEALVEALAPLVAHANVMTIFFPQGRPSDAAVHAKLGALGWKVPFVYQHLAEPYTQSLLDGEPSSPSVLLVSREGRSLFQRSWKETTAHDVAEAVDAAFGRAPSAGSSASEAAQKQ